LRKAISWSMVETPTGATQSAAIEDSPRKESVLWISEQVAESRERATGPVSW